jgi:imidazolonepropionase-like amidohydrolase
LWRSQYGPAELGAAVEEAHRAGLAVTGHAHGAQGIAGASPPALTASSMAGS